MKKLRTTIQLVIMGLLLINVALKAQDSLFQNISRMISQISEDRIEEHISILANAGGHKSRVTFTPGNDSAVKYIYNEFAALENLNDVRLDTFYIPQASPPYDTIPQFNVVATIDGYGESESYYLIGAHYDASASRMGSDVWENQWETIEAPGADDNATGVASILEMARVITDSANEFRSRYDIKLAAFGAEEYGPIHGEHHVGSRHYATSAKSNGDRIRAMISIDMVGYNDKLYTDIVSNQSSEWIGESIILANDLYATGLKINPPPFEYATYSDHDQFWYQGYPAILLIENAPPWYSSSDYNSNPFYHTSSDTVGTVNMELVQKIAQTTLAAVASMGVQLTDVEDEPGQRVVNEFRLSQNYPNPFNPTTKIKYKIPRSTNYQFVRVELIVYDILGRKVKTVINQRRKPGTYEVTFNAGNMSGGVYFYRLTAGKYTATRKMILAK